MTDELKAMSHNAPLNSEALADHELSLLRDLRLKLLHLHQSLLDIERASFERVFGRVNGGELLQLVINDAQFAWLRMVSALVVEIDEILSAEEPAAPSDVRGVITQTRLLFTSQENEEFRQKYQAALQHEPAVVMAHGEVMKLLRQEASINIGTSRLDQIDE